MLHKFIITHYSSNRKLIQAIFIENCVLPLPREQNTQPSQVAEGRALLPSHYLSTASSVGTQANQF